MAGYSSRCSVCTHPEADRINDMLRRRALGEVGLTQSRILEVVAELGGPVLTACAISRHASKHFDVQSEARRRAAERYDAASAEASEKLLTDVEALDKVIQMGVKALDDGDIAPDVKDIITAIKVKNGTVLRDDNPIEAIFGMVADAMGGDDGD